MAYSDFAIGHIGQRLGLTTAEADLFAGPRPIPVPAGLRGALDHRTHLALVSEKSRSEFIVAPILLASRSLSPVPLAIFSGVWLDVDANRGLTGECDFLLALAPSVLPLRAPIAAAVSSRPRSTTSRPGSASVSPRWSGPARSTRWPTRSRGRSSGG